MAHESFEDEAIANFLNEHFISIKVDREECPDIDAVYLETPTLQSGALSTSADLENAVATLARDFDSADGGFARYCVDSKWVVPHFEKMLYDNALLLRVYTHWWPLTGSELAHRVVRETVEFMLRELRTNEGVFASALDADSEGSEGTYYVWNVEKLILVTYAALTGESKYRLRGENALRKITPLITCVPRAIGWGLVAATALIDGPVQIAITTLKILT